METALDKVVDDTLTHIDTGNTVALVSLAILAALIWLTTICS